MFNVTPAVAGFIKGIAFVIVWAVVAYLADASHLSGVVSPALATLIASIFSAMESSHKAGSAGTSGLFGAVKIK